MSAAVTRAELAAAASTVAGIDCSPYFRQTIKPGDAMVRYAGTTYPNSLGGVVTWQVVVILPGDYTAAEKLTEEKVPAIVAALADLMVVNRVTPTQLQIESGTVPSIFIEGEREETP